MLPTCKEVADCKKEPSSSESRCNDEKLSTGESIKNIKPKLFPIFSKPRQNVHEILTIHSNEQEGEQEILKSIKEESPNKIENLKTNSRATEKIKGNVRVSKSTVPNNPSIVIPCDIDSSNHICEFEDVPIVKRRLRKVKHKLCDNVLSIPYDVTSANCNEKSNPSFKEIDAVVDCIITEVCSICDQIQPVRKCATTKMPQISINTKQTPFTNETSVFKENSGTNKLFPIFTSPKSLKSSQYLDSESILQERFSTEKDCKNQYLEKDQQSTKNASKKSSTINKKKRAKQKIDNEFDISHVSETDDLCSPIKNEAKTSILKKGKNSKKSRKIKKSKLNISLDTDYVSESSNITSPLSLKIGLSKKLSCEVFKSDKTENSSLEVPTLINQATIKDNQITVDSIPSLTSSEIIKVSTFTNEKEINKLFPLFSNLNTSPNSLKKSVKTEQEKKTSLLENSQSDITDTLHNDSLSFTVNKKENYRKQKRTKAASKKIDNVPENSVFSDCNLEPSNNSLPSEEVISDNKILSSGNKIDAPKRRTRNSLKRKQLYNSIPCENDSVDFEINNEYSSEIQQSSSQTTTENFKQHNKKRKKEIKSSMILSAELTISNNCLDNQPQINKRQKSWRQKYKTSLPIVETSAHDCSTLNKSSRVSKSSVLKNKLKNKNESSIAAEESCIRVTRSKTVRKVDNPEFSEIEKSEHKDKKSEIEKSKSSENLKRLPQVKKIIAKAKKKSNLAKNSEIKNVELFPLFNLANKKPKNLDSGKQSNKVKKIDAKKELTNCSNSKNNLESNIIVIDNLDNSISHFTKKKFLDLTEKNVDHSSPKQENIVRDQKYSEIKNFKPSYTFTKLVNNFTFPTYSHVNQVDTFKNTNFLKCSFKEEIPRDIITVPVWQGIMGLTDVKTFKDVEKMTYRERYQDFEIIIEDVENECQLWTEIPIDYNVGGTTSQLTIRDLNLWLSQWKTKFVKTSTKIKCNTVDNFSCDSNDSDMDDLSNSIIIMGPPGSGKTSLVSSLANDHGFKVLEVNASSSRSGRNINSQLKEALESYHVEKTQEMFFNSSTSENNTNNPIRKKVTGSSKDSLTETVKKTSINTFFKKTLASDKKNVLKKKDQANPKEITDKSRTCTISSNTIILFDDIDVVFEEDEGLWSTVRNFLKISKKPVVFTVSRNLDIVLSNLDLDVKVVYLQPMISNAVSKKVMKQCEQHKRTNANFDLDFTVFHQSNDIRRSLLHAQFWSQIPNENFEFNQNLENISNVNFLNNENCSTSLWYHINSLVMSTGLLNAFSHYHKVGYDILYCNLFSLLKVCHNSESKWQSISNQNSKISLGEVNYKIKDSYKDDHTDLWKEACEIFEAKKQTLQRGSHSSVLAVISETLDDFSFVESFKGFYCKSMNWISTPERVKCWGQGLPMCHDCIFKIDHENVLDMASLIQILKLKTMHKIIVKWEDSMKTSNFKFSAVGLNNSQQYKSENQINVVKSALPHNVSLNANALNLDYLSTLQIICRTEKLKQIKSGKRTNRFLHYFDSISLLIEKHDIEKIIS